MSGVIQPTKPAGVDLPAPPPATVSQPTQSTPALISSSPANQATAGASGLGGSAVMVIIIWAFSAVHVDLPATVAVALASLIGAGVHWAVLRYGMTPTATNE